MIEYDGIKWYSDGKYYTNSKHKRLHVYVWEKYNGKIPKGYDIHHIDHNRENNDISNLQLIERSEHHKMHMAEPYRKEQCRENIAKAIAAAPEWHASDAGHQWHIDQWQKSIGKHMDDFVVKECQVCGKEYKAVSIYAYRSKYCCNNCKATALRRRRKDAKANQ